MTNTTNLELAKNLATAYIATMGGFKSLDYVRKRYVDRESEEEIGTYWLQVADAIMSRALEAAPNAVTKGELLEEPDARNPEG